MPTNLMRRKATDSGRAVRPHVPSDARVAWLQAADVGLPIRLHQTQTAELIWRALPLYSIAETWGQSLHFEVPLRIGRDRTARVNGRAGEAYYWVDDERIVFAWGATPISRDREIRLMRPCNVWGEALGDPSVFDGLVPGAKIALTRAQAKR